METGATALLDFQRKIFQTTNMPARFLVGFVGVVAVFFSLFSPVFAQTTATSPTTVSQDVPLLAQGALWGMFSFTSCLLTGYDAASPQHKCVGYDPKTKTLGYVSSQPGGLLDLTSSAIAVLYSPPRFHVGTYLGYLGNNFGLAKHAEAATGPSGFDQLTPILKLWIAFRNVAYLLFVIVFVVIGFAVMLRARIDPRTVMTIENQIPKIIVALILVSFSYAIAGLVIDIMWLATFVTINLFATLDPSIQAGPLTQNITQNPLVILQSLSNGGVISIIMQPAGSVYDIMVPMAKQLASVPFLGGALGIVPCIIQQLGSVVSNPVGSLLSGVGNAISGNAGNAFGQCLQQGVTAAVAGIAGLAAFLIFAFALFFALFRMWFTLLKSYALFLVYAILGPFFILLGVLPGTKINFDNWFRHLLAYSLVFPFALGTLLLGKVISDVYGQSQAAYIPPLIGNTPATVSPMGPLIGFAIILLLPQALTMVQDSLSAPDIKYLPGIGQMLAAGTQAYSSVVGKPWHRLTRRENRMEGLSEGKLRSIVLGKHGSWQRHLLGDELGGKSSH